MDLQASVAQDLDHGLRTQAQANLDLRDSAATRGEEVLKEQLGIINTIREDMVKQLEADAGKIYGRVGAMVADANTATENSINTTIVAQLRGMDAKQAELYEKVSEVVRASKDDTVRNASTHDMLQEHMALMEHLNGKCDAQSAALLASGRTIDEKLTQFERGVIAELKAATEHMDLAAHEATFAKLEKDVSALYSELAQVRTDAGAHQEGLQGWVQRLSTDMKVFYDTYGEQLKEHALTPQEKEAMLDSISRTNGMVA